MKKIFLLLALLCSFDLFAQKKKTPCYVTQYKPEEMKEDHDRKVKDTNNFVHFRGFVVQKGLEKDFFKLYIWLSTKLFTYG